MDSKCLSVEEMELVPAQYTGASTDVCEEIKFNSVDEAQSFYELACEKLNNVNHWGSLSSIKLSTFSLFNKSGEKVDRKVEENDFIRIDIPGPGLIIGEGFDWVQVEKISHDILPEGNLFTIRVRPSRHPSRKSGGIAHFLQPCATSTFQIRRNGLSVFAEEHARNEKANLHTNNIFDNCRNLFVGTAARLGLSYPQWKSLIKGLIKN